MKPQMPRDPKAALEKARADLAAAEVKLGELAAQRQAVLVESDDVAAVTVIDASIDQQRKTAEILSDRIAVLAKQARQEEAARRRRERDAAIAKLGPGFAEREKRAQKLQELVAALGAARDALHNSGEAALAEWPEQFFARPLLNTRVLDKELARALYDLKILLPAKLGVGLDTPGIAGAVAAEHAALIRFLETTPLDEGEQEEAA
jgi:hypothetical protein